MQRRTQALLAVGGLVAVGLLAASVTGQPPQRIALETLEGADHVTLYQNGLAFVELNRTLDGDASGEAVLALSLPSTARFESLRLEGDGVTVKEVRSALASTGPLQAGDRVVVRTDADVAYAGTYLGDQGGALAVATEDGVALVQPQHVAAVEIVGGNATQEGPPGTVEARFLVDLAQDAQDVRVTYLAQGPGWTPSYDLDLDTGEFAFHAVLAGLHDWSNVTLDLVSGAPNVVLSPRPPVPAIPLVERAADESTIAFAASMDMAAESVPLGDLHRYRIDGPVSLARGETVRLLVEAGEAPIERRYYEARADVGWIGGFAGAERDVPVHERVTLRNALGEPLPPGVVLGYRDGVWVGEDRLEATPVNETTNLTLARSIDVEARLVLDAFEGGRDRDVATYALVVENGKRERVDARLELTYPAYRTELLDARPAPDETRGTTLTWDRDVPAGGEARVAATFASYHERLEVPLPLEEGGPRGAEGGGAEGGDMSTDDAVAPVSVTPTEPATPPAPTTAPTPATAPTPGGG